MAGRDSTMDRNPMLETRMSKDLPSFIIKKRVKTKLAFISSIHYYIANN